MRDEAKTKRQLIVELRALRKQLEKAGSTSRPSGNSEKRFGGDESLSQLLVDNMLDATLVLDGEGVILFANKASVHLIGTKIRQVASSLNVADFVVPDFKDSVLRHLNLMKTKQGSLAAEYKIYSGHGQEKWVEALVTRIKYRRTPVNLVTLRDITERKLAEEALRESEIRYRSLFNLANDAIFLMRGDRFVDCNPKTLEIFGCSREEILQQPPYRFSPPRQLDGRNSKEKAKEKIEAAFRGEPQFFEWLHCRFDGTLFNVEVSLNKMELAGEMLILAIVRDITDRKKAEQYLKESEEKYRMLVNRSPLGIFSIDTKGNITILNSSVLNIVGSPSIEETKKINLLQFPLLQKAGISDAAIKCIHTGKSVKGEFPYLSKWGKKSICRLYLDPMFGASGKLTGVQGIIEDITEQKQAEKALIESEQKYRNLIEHSGDAIYLLYNRKFEIVNKKFQEMFGVKLEDMNKSGFDFLDLVSEKSKPYLEERAERLANGEDLESKYEFTAISKNGKEIEVEAAVSYIEYKDGVATQGIIRDITERKRLEKQLLQAQKMEAIGRLAGGVAHDFNNILTIIRGYSELMLSRIDEKDTFHKSIKQVTRATERAELLTRQLLAFSRKQIMQARVIDLNELIKESEKLLRPLIGEDIEFIAKLAHTPCKIKVDPGQMEQVIMNLVVNSRDAMPSGGRITIETKHAAFEENNLPNKPEISKGNYIVLSISDTGIGIDKKAQSQIFEPFFTTKEKGKGTGLGLSTIYGIVKQSNGYIYLESEPNRGSTFMVYLPSVEQKIETMLEPQTPQDNLGGSETILVAEDEEEVRSLVCETLRKHGYTVLEARNGKTALRIYQNSNNTIDLVLTDVIMPLMNGRELVDRLSENNDFIKTLFMSGYTDDAILHHGVLEPGTQFIQKPFSPGELLEKIRKILDGN